MPYVSSQILINFLLIFLYIVLGFIINQKFKVNNQKISAFIFYYLIPITVFKATLHQDINFFLKNALIGFILTLLFVVAAYILSYFIKKNRNFQESFGKSLDQKIQIALLTYSNIGWFGIPIAYSMYGKAGSAIMTAFYFGSGLLYGNTVGYLLVTNSRFVWLEILQKLIRIPALYAIILGGFFKYMNVELAPTFIHVFDAHAYILSFFGMFLVGSSLGKINDLSIINIKLDLKYSLQFICMRFLMIVLLCMLAVLLLSYQGLISQQQINLICLFMLLPIASNVLVFAHKNEVARQHIAFIILLSNLSSCFLIVISSIMMNLF